MGDESGPASGSQDAKQSPLGLLVCSLLTISGLVGGGVYGWSKQETLYEATGRLVVGVPSVWPKEESGTAARARREAVFTYHLGVLESHRATVLAVAGIGLEDTSHRPPVTGKVLRSRCEIGIASDGKQILIRYRDQNPAVAHRGVDALIQAHQKITKPLQEAETRYRDRSAALDSARFEIGELDSELKALGTERGATVAVEVKLRESRRKGEEAKARLASLEASIQVAEERHGDKEMLEHLREAARQARIAHARHEKDADGFAYALKRTREIVPRLDTLVEKKSRLELECRALQRVFVARGLAHPHYDPVIRTPIYTEPTIGKSLPWAALGGVWGLVLGLGLMALVRRRADISA